MVNRVRAFWGCLPVTANFHDDLKLQINFQEYINRLTFSVSLLSNHLFSM